MSSNLDILRSHSSILNKPKTSTLMEQATGPQITTTPKPAIVKPSVQAARDRQYGVIDHGGTRAVDAAMPKLPNNPPVSSPSRREAGLQVLEQWLHQPNMISDIAARENDKQMAARAALGQDTTTADAGRSYQQNVIEKQKDGLQGQINDVLDQIEIAADARDNKARLELSRTLADLRSRMDKLNSRLSELNTDDIAEWENRQYNEIMASGGSILMATLEKLNALTDAKINEAVERGDERRSDLTELEKEYFAKYGELKSKYGDRVDSWLDYIERMKNNERMGKALGNARSNAENRPFWSSLGSIPLNMLSGFGYLDIAGQNLQRVATGSDTPIDYNSPAQTPSKMTNTIRETVSEDMSGAGRFLYNTAMSLGDSAIAIGTAKLGFGQLGTVLLGGAAATNATQAAAERGASDGQALMVGLIAGAAETLLEKASIDSLFGLKDPKTLKDIILNVLKQAGAEGTEEGLTNIINTIADGLIMRDKSELETIKRRLMADGMSREEAEIAAIKEWAIGFALDVAGGILSGGVTGSFKSAADYARSSLRDVSSRVDSAMPTIPQAEQQTQTAQPAQPTVAAKPTVDNVMPRVQTEQAAKPDNTNTTPTPEQIVRPDEQNRTEEVKKPAMGAADSGFNPYSHASIEHGAFKPGENPSRVVDVPKSMDGNSNVMQTVRTIMEADATPDTAIPELEQAVVDGEFSRMPITDQAAAERAESTIRRVGYQQALADWRTEVRNGHVSKDSVAVGETLYNAAINAGDTKSAVKIAVELASQVRSAAQALQAVRMLKKMSPAAQLYGVKQSVDNLQKTLIDKYGKRAPDLVINEDLAAAFLEAETDADRAAAEEAMYKDIARQIPETFADKWNAWRYLSMLGNVRTHVRNIAGNAMFAPVLSVKNKFGALLEVGAQAVGLIDRSQRTKSFGAVSKDLLTAAKADYENVKQQILSAGKYNSASDIIEKNRQIFNPRGAKLVGKVVERTTGKTLPQWAENISVEGLRKGNSWLLDAEDSFFAKRAYASSLASYLKAQGFTAADFTGDGMTVEQKDAARAYAIKEAQKATYRDINGFSKAISSIGFKAPGDSMTKHAMNAIVEGIMPFKKTPANILVRSVEYSPAGLVKALTVDAASVAKGKISAGEYMDRLASGLTGTGLFALGWLLSNMGLLVGGTPEDEEQEDLEGKQPYALEVGGKSITLDWLAPEAMPVFMGVELAEAIREGGGDSAFTDKVVSFLQGLTGPMLEMSMMSALQDAMEATEYADNKVIAFLANGALGYLKQALPTLFGQLERSLESSVRETTFTQEGNKYLGKDAQYMLGSIANKVPFVDYNQIPYIDAWGRTEDQGGSGKRLTNNMLNPAYISDIQETAVDQEIKRLEKQTGKNLTPARANATLTINGRKILLTSEEYVTYAKAKGQNDFTFRQSLIDAENYGALDDPTKVKAMEFARDLADAFAVREAGFDDPKMADWQKELVGADINTITKALIGKAVDSQAGLLGENKYAGLGEMLESNTIDEQLALACLGATSQTAYGAYEANCVPAGVSVSQFLDAYGTAKAADKDNGDIQKQAALDYIEKMDLTPEQKGALASAVFSAIGKVIVIDSPVSEQWLLDTGDIDRLEAQMGRDDEKQPERYVRYEKYIKDSPVDMQTYLDFYNFAKDAENQNDNSRQDQIIDWLEKLDAPDEVKGRLFCTACSRSSCPLKWRTGVPRD